MHLRILSILLCASLFFSCRNAKKAESALPELSIGVMSSMDYLPLAVAQKNGYFTENGIRVTLQKFYSANERDAALQSGNLDGSILDYTGGAIQRSGGQDIQFASQCDGTFQLFVSEASGVDNLAGLKGKNIAVSRNTVIDFCTDAALSRAGLSETDVQKSEINKIPLRLEMLRNAKIDATMLPDPFATMARSGGSKAVTSMEELGFNVTGIAFHEKSIREKAGEIKKFYAAYNKAVDDLNGKPPEEFRTVLTEDVGFPEALLSDVRLPRYSHATLPRTSDLEATDKWLNSKQLVAPDFDIRSLVAPGLIP